MKTLLMFVLASMAFGQATAPPAPPTVKSPQPVSIPVNESQQNKILKASHALDALQKRVSDLQIQWDALIKQQADLQQQYQSLAPKVEDAKKAKQDVTDAVAKAAGLDPEKYDVSDDGSMFIPKPEKK